MGQEGLISAIKSDRRIGAEHRRRRPPTRITSSGTISWAVGSDSWKGPMQLRDEHEAVTPGALRGGDLIV